MNKLVHAARAAFLLALPLAWPAASALASETSEPAGPANLVMWVVLLVWFAIGAFLFKIDRDLSRLEKKIDER